MTVSTQELDVYQNANGVLLKRWILTVTGLGAGAANTIPHGMPRPPVDAAVLSGDQRDAWIRDAAR